MGCNCGRPRAVNKTPVAHKDPARIMEEYRYLKPYQVKARLEVFKRSYCTNCEKRYQCDYGVYISCTARPQ